MSNQVDRLCFDINGKRIVLPIKEAKTRLSKHTGRALRILTAELYVDAGYEVIVNDFLHRPSPIQLFDAQSAAVGLFDVRLASTSFEVGPHPSRTTYILEFTEYEEIVVASLILNDRIYVPYYYQESTDTALVIRARMMLTQEQHNDISELVRRARDSYFDVIRVGLSDVPVKMRFGVPKWSQHQDLFKHEMVLVHEAYDTIVKSQGLGSFEQLRETIIEHECLIKRLLYVLQAAGVLTPSQIEEVREISDVDYWNARYSLMRVDDVDSED